MPRRSLIAGLALLLTPVATLGFEAVDALTPSSSGRFPAYPMEEIPVHQYWVQMGLMIDTNMLRRTVSDGTSGVVRLGVGGRQDTRVYGRQTVHLEGRLDAYVYDRYDNLDNVAYGGLAEWRWELGNDLAGILSASRRRYQADLAQIQTARRDLITETRVVANGAYRVGPSFRLRGGAEWTDYNRPGQREAETQTLAGFAGIDYVSPLNNTLGLEYRQAHGGAPVNELVDPLGVFVNNGFRQRDVALVAGFFSPQLRFGGRVGRTERSYTALPGRDFKGTTYRANAEWLPGNKTALGLEIYKEPRSIIDIGASHVLVKGYAFGPGWAPTAKLSFSARAFHEHLTFSGDPSTALGVTALREEIVRGVRLGAYWEYTRQTHFTFAVDHGDRESSTLGRDFRYNAVIANARYLF